MNEPIIETLAVTFLGCAAYACGWRISKERWWAAAYIPAAIMLFLVTIARLAQWVGSAWGFSWITRGRNEFIILGVVIPVAFSLLVGRLKIVRTRVLLIILMAVSWGYYTGFPFLAPALAHAELAALKTTVCDGVCLQTTNYTCGPAAAVTALLKLGIEGEESAIGIAAKTCRANGTDTELLAEAVTKLYGDKGVCCKVRHFASIPEMKDQCPNIAVVKFGFLVDHYVTVLEVTETKVVIGDPLEGLTTLSHTKFREKWRSVGVVAQRSMPDVVIDAVAEGQ